MLVGIFLGLLTLWGIANFWFKIPRGARKFITHPKLAWLLDLLLNLGLPGGMMLLTQSVAGAIASGFAGFVLDLIIHFNRKGIHLLGLNIPGLHQEYYDREKQRKEFLQNSHR